MGFWSKVAAVVGIVAAPFTGGASLLLTAAAVVAPKVIDKVVDFVMKPFMGLMGMPTMDMGGAQEAERQQGVLLQRTGSVVNIPVVYGYRKVGDIVTFAETGATDNKYLWVAHVLSEGTIGGLKSLYLDDNLLPDGVAQKLNNGETVIIDSGKYKNRVKLQLFKGVYYTDPTDVNHTVRASCFFNTDSDKPPNWTNDMVYNGLAVVFARYEWFKVTTQAEQEANPFGYSIPKLTVEMYGKILSPVPSTAPAAEYDGDTARYEIITTSSGQTMGYTNPVEVLLDYLRNPRYGKGLANADIDWASWYVAAQKCKTEVTYVNGVKGPILSMNYVLETGQSIFSNTKALLSNFRGYMPYVQGKYKLKIEDAGHPTDILSGSAEIAMAFDKSEVIGEIVWTGIDRTSKYNQVVVTWVDPDNKWSNQEVVYPETESERQLYIVQDGNRENKGTFTASGITNPIMAKDLARILFWKSRLSDSVSVTVSSKALELEPGDCIHVSGNLLTFNTVYPWRVVSTQLNNDMTVTLGCVFVPDTIFPYTRWNEPDKLLPVYVPKGGERFYPKITPSEKNGLLPPYPDKPINAVGGNPTTPLIDVIDIIKIRFLSMDANSVASSSNVHFELEFNQPNTSLYAGVKVYWKEDVASAKAWQEVEFPLNSGPGVKLYAQAGPVTYGRTYVMNTRVLYQSGQASTITSTIRFTVNSTSVTPFPTVTGTPTPPPTAPVNTFDNFFVSVVANTLLDGSVPKNPRQVQFTLKQDMTAGANSYLDALEIFWKPSANPKWSYTKTTVSGAQGNDILTTLTLGPRVYPLRPGVSGEAPLTVDDYDFIFRFAYNDGKVSQYQYHAYNCSIEYNGTSNGPFNPLALIGPTIVPKELSSSYIPQIATSADIVDTRNIEISSPYLITDNGATTPGIKFTFYPPVDSDRANWRGVRIYRHKAGVAGLGDYVDFTPATITSGVWSVLLTGITYDENWEYVITTLVSYGNETYTSYRGQYIVAKIHSRTAEPDYPAAGNWATTARIQSFQTLSTALANRGTAVVSPPRQDTFISTFNSATVLTSSVPSSPRKLSFTFTQSTTNGTNGNITGYVVYYKQSDAVYWKRSVYTLTGYTEGNTITFDSTQVSPVMDLGFPGYPSNPGRGQFYDFAVRFIYNNSTESTYESVWLNKAIEVVGTSLSFAFLGTAGTAPRRSSLVLTTEDKAPPGAVIDVRNILTSTAMAPVSLDVLENNPKNILRFGFSVPIAQMIAYLAGFRILRRDVISGATTQFTTDDSNIPYKSFAALDSTFTLTSVIGAESAGTAWNKEYEWAVIPLVWYQGARVEANNALWWRGRVSDVANSLSSNPYVSNWYSKRVAEIQTTTEIRNRLSAPFAATDPYARVNSITRLNPNFTLPSGEAFGSWAISWNLPLTFHSMKVYRRQCHNPEDSIAGPLGFYQRKGDFGLAGQWEVMTVTGSSHPATNNGSYLTQGVLFRPAIANYFNDTTYASGLNVTYAKDSTLPNGSVNTLYKGGRTIPPGSSNTTFPKYWLAGDAVKGANQQSMITQLLVVITTVNNLNVTTESNTGILINLYNSKVVAGANVPNAPGNVVTDVSIVNVADFNAALDVSKLDLNDNPSTVGRSRDASWTTLLRKTTDAVTVISDANIVSPGTAGWATAYTKPLGSI